MAAAELTRIQHEAIRDVVRLQQEVGLRLATDGEYNRLSWQRDFLLKIGNVKPMASKLTVRFHSAAGTRDHTPPSLQVVGKLSRPQGIFVDDFKFLKSVVSAGVTAKITIPSPTIVHFRGGREAIDARAYPQMEAFYDDLAAVYRAEIADLAAAGCRYLQIDEVNLAYLCDPELRRQVGNIGEDPATLAEDLCQAAQRRDRRQARRHDGVHASVPRQFRRRLDCRGRLRADRRAFVQRDRRRRLFPRIRLRRAPEVSRRCAFCRRARSPCSASSPPKARRWKAKDELKRRIEEASRYVPIEQLALSPQCGFSAASAATP